MAKKKPTEKLRMPGTPALMHTSKTHVVSTKKMDNKPGTVPIVFPPGYKNRAARRNVPHRKKLATRELRGKLIDKGVNHNTAGIMARILMSNPPKSPEPEAQS